MTSTSNPLHIIEDDDEFDWEAAVREIDVACSSGTAVKPVQEIHKNGKLNFASVSSAKQSTLDRFIGVSSRNLKKPGVNSDFLNNGNHFDEPEGVEMVDGFVKIDPQTAKTWIYPVNVPRRDYQFSITRTALFSNTLVVLPTGLGKTLIAAVVMYNYFRWFPEGKIVFAAPSRPLVMQQIEACHNIVGIPQEWTIDLTGQTSPVRRASFWKDKRVFFVTPQVLEKDIHSGSCLVKNLVCLVIDEAHRATGNYSYCVAVRELMDTPVQLRILALTATPGSKQETIQNVINNLQISTLEYRNESDPDVLSYVHERKIELIQVAMGYEAVETNNLLLEVVRPYVARLSAFGVLQKRDFQTLSPCDLLNSRDKFRQQPPLDLPHIKYGEIEGYFGVLITLYHIRKLLSSHGIRPAFEMLDEKLKQGSFARLMSRNEVLLKAKLLMQQTVSHGAPSPKLAKLLEVLIEHFKVKDPQNSRVIIFSNFRGSVRDILNALTNIGEFVKATEFIGQSSGKNSKGQSQKVQQAVLQKFRTGGYNVIVATSIGEEGLDIMEVDLVICFDANVSPLRMIQRMGRTGRKHEGRVVVLACEGSEMKGYMRKQANSKTIKKHMYNGGMNSFTFHSSPRMVPHIFKPEVQFLEMSIEEFIPRGKKVKDDDLIPVPMYKTKLTDFETGLLAKYFVATEETVRRPSLIAFPHFQAFPSPVNKVVHSSRTGMLIDTMQYLQGLTYSEDCKTLLTKDKDFSDPGMKVDTVEFHDEIVEVRSAYPDEENLKTEVVECDMKIGGIARTEDEWIEDFRKEEPCLHTFLFGSEFVSVDDLGNVLVLSLPQLPLKSHYKSLSRNIVASENHLMDNSNDHEENTIQTKVYASLESGCPADETLLEPSPRKPDLQKGIVLSSPEEVKGRDLSSPKMIYQTPSPSRKSKEMGIPGEDDNVLYEGTSMQLADELGNEDSELSPRLTNFIKSGIVPESPINNAGTWNGGGDSTERSLVASQNMRREFMMNTWQHDAKVFQDGSLSKTDVSRTNNDDIQVSVLDLSNNSTEACVPPVPVATETQSPFVKPSNTSNSGDWLLDSGVNHETVERQCKFRRLRKLGDLNKKLSPESKERTGPSRKLRTSRVTGGKKRANDVAVFIDEEAEISSDGMASADEEGEQDNSSYEDSFIDDGPNSISTNTQAGASRIDMMAIYRRSLLSQSPFQQLPTSSTSFSPDSVVQGSRTLASGSSSGTKDHTPQTGAESTARNSQATRDRLLSELIENENKLESRKRKLSFYQGQSVPMVNLDKEFSSLCETAGDDSSKQIHSERMERKNDVFEDADDHFFECIDLDAVEEEAAKLLRYKSECSTQKTTTVSEPIEQHFGILGSPNFDLGV